MLIYSKHKEVITINNTDFLNDLLKAYSGSYQAKDDQRMDIVCRKKEYENTLNKMWSIYMKGNSKQIIAYQEQVDIIKRCGCKVYRNSNGVHKIVV